MDKIAVELDLPHNALTEVIPGLSIYNLTGEHLAVKVEVGPFEQPTEPELRQRNSVRGTGSEKRPE